MQSTGCIDKLTNSGLDPTKFRFRFTIGSTDDSLLKFWEPYAPSFDERFACLQLAHSRGYDCSVSMEPMLEPPYKVMNAIDPYVSSVWLGYMNYQKRVVYPDIEEIVKNEYFERLKEADFLGKELVEKFCQNTQVFFKNSILEPLLKEKKRSLGIK